MKQSFYISIVVAMQLLATLCSQLLVIRIIGAGSDTDAYIAAQAVPSVLVAIITTALQSVWLPRLAILSSDVAAWRQEQSIAQGQAGLLGGGLLLLMGAGIPWWLPLLYPGFSMPQQQNAMSFCLVLLLAAAFNTQSALLTVALRSRGRFLAAEWIALLGTVSSLAAMYFMLPLWGIVAAAWIALGRAILVYAAQMCLANWPPISFRKGWGCKESWQLMRPLLLGASIYKTSPLVDRYWASQAPAGGITTLSVAQTMIGSLATIMERVTCMPITPRFSHFVKECNYSGLQHAYRNALLKITIFVFLISLTLFFSKPAFLMVASMILKMQVEIASSLWLMCFLLVGYLHAAVSGSLLVAVFYALNDTKTPVYIGISGFLFGLILKFILFKIIGLNGLVISASIYFLVNIIFFILYLEKKVKKAKGEM